MDSDSFEIETKLNLSVLKDPDSESEETENTETLETKSQSSEYSSNTTLKTAYSTEKEPFIHIMEGVLNQIEVQESS